MRRSSRLNWPSTHAKSSWQAIDRSKIHHEFHRVAATKTENSPEQYWEDRLGANWGFESVGYYGLGRPYNYWLYKIRKLVFLRQMKALIEDFTSLSVLDIGSGTGFYVDLWRSLGVNSVVATDITNVAVKKLRDRFPDQLCIKLDAGDILQSDEHTARYDIVSAMDVLFHIVDDNRYRQAIQNVSQALKPGGHLVISENFVHGQALRANHEVSRPLSEITEMLEEAGFEIVSRVPVFALMNNPIDSNSRLLRIFWRLLTLPPKVLSPLGHIVGPLIYPVEALALSIVKEGPSTEMMICKKRI